MSENYSYDSIGAANASSSALQAGFVNRVFGWMTGGLALTGAMAWAVYNIEPLYKLVLGTPERVYGADHPGACRGHRDVGGGQ